MSFLKSVKDLYDQGFAIHWLKERSKAPLESGWGYGAKTPTWEHLVATYRKGYNVGVRLGTPSRLKAGGYLMVIDVDVKSEKPHHREEALTAARKVLADGGTSNLDVPVVRSGFGNGSRHYYVVTDKPFKTFNAAASPEKIKARVPSKKPSKKELESLTPAEIKAGIRLVDAWQVSLYSDGRQVVLPPSIHPDTGRAYEWRRPISELGQVPLLKKLPRSYKEQPDGVAESSPPASARVDSPTDDLQTKSSDAGAFSFKPEKVEIAWLPISKEVKDAIVHGTGITDRSGYLMRATTALLSAGLTHNQVLSVLTDKSTYLGACGYEHAQTKDRKRAAHWVWRYTLAKVARERDAGSVFEKVAPDEEAPTATAEEKAAIAREIAAERSWKQDLVRTEKGHPRICLKNLDLILTNVVGEKLFVEDHFASRIEYGVDTPWGGEAGNYIEDRDMVRVKRWLADTEFRIEPTKDAILEATGLIADRHKFHPVRDWLDSLKWDGVPRIDTWLRDLCRARAPEPYLSEVSRKFLLAMVKRVFEPGCQWDYVLVLEGEQGKYKSSIARALAGDRWFMDNIPDLKDKDAMLNLQGKWLIELAELADVKRADYNLVKAYLIRRTDTVRPHYGRLKADVPRQSVFIGTINEGQYLKDPTGNRRYWPVRVGRCDVEALKEVRDQLFAEAMHVYRETGEILMLSRKANLQATEAQEDRRIDDDESEMKDALLAFRESPVSASFPFDKFRTRDLMVGPNAPWGPWGNGKGYIYNIAAHILTSLKFERFKSNGRTFWRQGTA